jgi:putative transposase
MIFDYIEGFYNRCRRHSSLGYLPPEQFETRFISSKASQAP